MPGRLREHVGRIFQAAGMVADDADLLAASLVSADQRGIHSHGVLRVPDYVVKLTGGGVDPRGRPTVTSRLGGAIVVDGGNAMGQIAMGFAMDRAVEAAREHGVSFTAVGPQQPCGSHGFLGDAGVAARDDRACRHQRAADDGALGAGWTSSSA